MEAGVCGFVLKEIRSTQQYLNAVIAR